MRYVTAPSQTMVVLDPDLVDLHVEMEELSLDMVLLSRLLAGRLPARNAAMCLVSSARMSQEQSRGRSATMSPDSSAIMYPGNSATMSPGSSAVLSLVR